MELLDTKGYIPKIMSNTITGFSVLDEAIATVEKKKKDAEGKKNPKPSDGRKPPEEGKCRRCGADRPLNRLKLCYRCFVISNIEDVEKKRGSGWRSVDPHPAWCDCTLPEHKRNSTGN